MKKKATSIKAKLRSKAITENRRSLYLDFYPAILNPETGRMSRREFLGLYVHEKTSNPIDREHNRQMMLLAQSIRQRREMELNKDAVYGAYERQILAAQQAEKERGERDFIAYFKELADKRKSSNYNNWMSALYFLETYAGGSLKFANLNEKWCNDFRHYICNADSKKSRKRKVKLSINTTVSYFNKFKAALKQAYKDGLLNVDLNRRIEYIKPTETQRNFLTEEELNILVRTECEAPLLKSASLFSALTGLRHSDIQKLEWREVGYMEGIGYYLQFRQKKTGHTEVQPISEQAYKLLGEKGAPNTKVFDGLTYSAYHNRHLYTWLGKAGITKHITFHCFRHTYATLLLNKGANLATVSKMLGHRDIKTTLVYAKVIDQSKREAANLIQLAF